MEKIKEYWPFGKGEVKRDIPAPGNKVPADQLSLYPEPDSLSKYRFIEDDPLPMQQAISRVRTRVQDRYARFMNKFGTVQRLVSNSQTAVTRAAKYVREEGTVLPKATAITIGGMSGFLFGMKRGGVIVRSFYSGFGMTVVAAFCYPHETVDLTRTACRTVKQKWSEFSASPEPPKIELPEKDLSIPPPATEKVNKAEENKDIDMYTTRSKIIS